MLGRVYSNKRRREERSVRGGEFALRFALLVCWAQCRIGGCSRVWDEIPRITHRGLAEAILAAGTGAAKNRVLGVCYFRQ